MFFQKQKPKTIGYLRRQISLCLVLVFSVLLLSGLFSYTRGGAPEQAVAATSSNLNIQARLYSTSGNVVPDGYYNVEFKMYDALTSGSLLWTESWYDSNGVTAGNDNRVRIVNGYMSVQLGSHTALPSVNWDDNIYISLNIGGTTQTATPTYDGEMSPRIKLNSVPFAQAARNVQSGNTSAASTNSGNISIQTGNATGATSNSGNVTLDVGTATGTAGTISVGTANTSGITIGRVGVITAIDGQLTVSGTQFTNNGSTVNGVQSLGDFPTGGSIGSAASTVDVDTAFSIAQTTAGQTINLPSPTVTTAGRIVYILNTGSASFTMEGVSIAAGYGQIYIWNGSSWRLGATGGSGTIALQAAYDGGNTIVSSDARNIDITLANTATDANFLVNIATGSTGEFKIQNNGTDVLQIGSAGQLQLDTQGATGGILLGGDTNIYRSAANTLKTDDDFVVGNNLTITALSGNLSTSGNISTTGTGTITSADDLAVNGDALTTDDTTFNLLNTTATTINAFGAATTISLGAGSGTTTVNNNLTVTGLLTANGNLTLQTGDTFTMNGDAFTDLTGDGLTVSSNALTVDTTSATGLFRNGGNSFSGAATLGTNDANVLNFETAGTNRFQIASNGAYLTGQGNTQLNSSGGALYIGNTSYSNGVALGTNTTGANTINIGDSTNINNVNLQGAIGINIATTGASNTVQIGNTTGAVTQTINIGNNSTASSTNNVNIGSQQGGTTAISGNLATRKGTDYSTVAGNNAALGNASLVRLTGASAQTITGIASGTDGRRVTLLNASGFTATISNNSGSSLAANRITTGTGADISLLDGSSIELIYDSTASLWRVTGSVGFSTGNFIQNGTSPQTADFNITGDGVVGDDLAVNGDSITTDDTTFYLLNTTATTINAFGAATAINIGASAGSTITGGGELTLQSGGTNTDFNINTNGSGNIYIGNNNTGSTNIVWIGNTDSVSQDFYLGASNSSASSQITLGNVGTVTLRSSGVAQNTSGNNVRINAVNNDAATLNIRNSSNSVVFQAGTDGSGVVIADNLAINGGGLTSSATTFDLLQSNVTTLNIGGAVGAGGINFAGGSASTGCTIDGSNGNLVCSGNITGASTGTVGYWSRSGTTLQPATSGDNITTSGNISTTGTGTITSADDLAVNGDAITTDDTTFNLLNTTATTINAFGAASTINLGAAGATVTNPGSLNIRATGTNTLDLDTTGAGTIGLGDTNATTIGIGNTTAATAVNIQGGTTGGINIGSVGSSTAGSTIHIGDTSNATGSQAITIGSTAAQAGNLTTIQGGSSTTVGTEAIRILPGTAGSVAIGAATGTGTITLGKSTATNTISIGSATPGASSTQTISIGNGSMSNASSSIAVNILSGAAGTNGTASLLMGNNDRVTQIDIGNVAADAARTLNFGTGNNTVGIDTLNIGTGNTTVAGGKTINIGTGTPTGSGTNLITIGSTANASSTTVQGGSAGVTVKTGGSSGSTTAFQIQNAAGTATLFTADTANNGLSLVQSTFSGNLLPNVSPSFSTTSTVSTTYDTGSSVIFGTSVAIGADGLPVVYYYDNTPVDTKILKCSNIDCTSGSYTIIDLNGGSGGSIEVGRDGLPIVTYRGGSDLKAYKCSNASCTTGSAYTLDAGVAASSIETSLAIGYDGFPIVSYYDYGNTALKVYKCSNASCSSGSATTPDNTADVGRYNSMAIGTDGLPVISYYDTTNTALNVVKCGNASCSSGNTITQVDNTATVGLHNSIAIGTDGLPVISYHDSTNTALKVYKCSNASCSSGSATTPDNTASVGQYTSIAIGRDGYPVISYHDSTNLDLVVYKCSNAGCSSGSISAAVDSSGTTGQYTSIAIGTDGLPIISHSIGGGADDLRITHCGNTSCSGSTSTLSGGIDIGSISTSFQNIYANRIGTIGAINPFSIFTNGVDRLTIDGTGLATLSGNLDVVGSTAFRKGTDFSTTGTSNNVNFGEVSLVRLTGASAQTITGIANGRDGEILTIVNAASQSATISNNSGSSSAGNQIITGTGANITLAAGGSITLVYDSTAGFWRVTGSVAFSTGNFIQNGTSQQTSANFNIRSASAGSVGAVIQGTTAQTADIFQLKDENNLSLLAVGANAGYAIQSSDGFTSTNAFTVGVVNSGVPTTIFGVNSTSPGVYTGSTTFSVFNTTATTINAFGAASTINLGAAGATITNPGSLNIRATGTNTLDLDTTGAGTIGLGDTNATTIGIGNTTAATQTTIQGGTGTSAVNIQAGAAGDINIGTVNNNDLNINTAAVAGTTTIGGTGTTGQITIGQSTATNAIFIGAGIPAASTTQTISIGNAQLANASSAIAVNILSGAAGTNGTASLLMGNNDRVTQIDIGNVAADAARTLNFGTGNNTVGIDTLNIGTGNTTVAGGKTINIGTGTPTGSGTNLITIGSIASGIANTTTIQGGNGLTAVNIQAAASGTINMGTTNNNNVAINTAAVAGTTTIGGTGTTGQITIGQSTATNTISIGSATPGASSTQTINIGNGSLSNASSSVVVNLLSGAAGTNGTASLLMGNNDRVTQIDIGNVAADAARTLNFGTGNNTVGIDTLNIGTGNTTVAGGKTINIGTGTPTGSGTNLITIGSTANASTTTIQGGTGAGGITLTAAGSASTGVMVRNSTNSTAAFQIQNASSQSLFVADTTNQRLAVGPAAVPANGVLTVGTNTTANTGGIFFGTDTNLYRYGAGQLASDGSVISTTGSFYTTAAGAGLIFGAGNTSGIINALANGAGDLYIYNGSVNPIATFSQTGTALFRNSTNSTVAFQIQSATGSDTMFIADTTAGNKIKIGNSTGTGTSTTVFQLDAAASAPFGTGQTAYLGSMYYDSTQGKLQCYENRNGTAAWGACGSAPNNIITLTPEYTGAVLNGTGVGTLTADFCSNESTVLVVGTLCANHEARNFYKWTSPQGTDQTYSIFVTHKLPSTFSAFSDANTMKLTALTDNTTNANATLQVFRKNVSGNTIVSCGSATTINNTANTWQQTSFGGDETACGFTGGDYVIFRINVTAKSGGNVYVENLDFTYTNQ